MTSRSDIDALIALGPLKVWSVVVTIMGDLCGAPGDRIEGPVLGRLVEEMGINNQALRVALHRLKRDGWIEAEKDGRVSSYALTAEGRARSEAARPVIYASAPPPAAPVWLVLPPPAMSSAEFAEALPDDTAFANLRAAITWGDSADLPEAALLARLDPRALPDWIAELLIAPEALADYRTLTETLRRLGPPPDDPLAAAVIRLLAFHHWRRLRLRHGALPDLLLGPDWPGAEARTAVGGFLDSHPRPVLADLRAAALARA